MNISTLHVLLVSLALGCWLGTVANAECVDNNDDCGDWANSGECQKNPAYMLVNCKKSCNVCSGATTTTVATGSCVDNNDDCGDWANSGECQNNPAYMLVNCKKSCNVCNGASATTTVAPGPTEPSGGCSPEGACNSCVGGVQAYSGRHPNFYKKLCLTRRGLRVVSSAIVPDQALHRSAFLIDQVAKNVPAAVIDSMNSLSFQHTVMAKTEITVNVPEHSAWPDLNWARGLGATESTPTGSGAEENAMCHSDDKYKGEDITIHEFAHSLHHLGLAKAQSSFNPTLKQLYNETKALGASSYWSGHYANWAYEGEYWAEAVQSYFDANYASKSKNEFQEKDPKMFKFVEDSLGGVNWKWSCA